MENHKTQRGHCAKRAAPLGHRQRHRLVVFHLVVKTWIKRPNENQLLFRAGLIKKNSLGVLFCNKEHITRSQFVDCLLVRIQQWRDLFKMKDSNPQLQPRPRPRPQLRLRLRHMGPIWGSYGSIWAAYRPHIGPVPYGNHRRPIWEPFGAHMSPYGTRCGPIWAPYGAHMGAHMAPI